MQENRDLTAGGATGADAPRTIVFFDHTAKMGGGEIALLNLVLEIDRSLYKPIVVLGEEGVLADRLRAGGAEVHILALDAQVAHTRKESLGSAKAVSKRDVLVVAGYVLRLRRFLREHGAFILHTNSLKADILGGIAGRLAGVTTVWHVRDRIADDYLPPAAARIFRWLCRVLPHYIVVNSRATLDALSLSPSARARVVYNGIDGSRVHVVHDGIVESDNGVPAAHGEAPPLPSHSPLMGLVGRISPWKGQHIFLHAAALVLKEFPQARFQIIGAPLFGEEAYEQEVRALSRSLQLEEAVEFTGFRSDIPAIVASLDILVHASTTGEPFGQVIIEGMAARKPVVATNGGGVPEIVVEGETGLLVPMGDAEKMAEAISWLLRHPERARQMGQAGCKRVRDHFTIAHTAQSVQALYAHIESTREPGSPRAARFKVPAALALLGVLLVLVRHAASRFAKSTLAK
jgi:glycosyltransferase involved in cell wall biosynthesis